MPTFKECQRKRFDRIAEQLLELLSMNAPDNLLALTMTNLTTAAEGAFGEELYLELLKQRNNAHRQGAAYCQYCDNRVAIERSHYPICELCDAAGEKFADEMDKEIKIDPGDDDL